MTDYRSRTTQARGGKWAGIWLGGGVLVLACGSAPSSSSEAEAGAPEADARVPEPFLNADARAADAAGEPRDAAPSPDASPPRCAGLVTLPRDAEREIRSGERDRKFRVHVPTTYDPTRPTPVVLVLHAFGSSATEMAIYARFNEKSDTAGFIAVHPEGVLRSWNAGACCGEAARNDVSDVAFIRDVLSALARDTCVDERRVFATGMSNGGFLSHRLGCELSDRIAAIAPVAGVLGVPTCSPPRPVPVLQFHGTADTVVPFGGSSTLGFRGVLETIDLWKGVDGCSGPPRETLSTVDAKCETWSACRPGGEVALCTVRGGGHTWPGGLPIVGAYTTPNVDATDLAWEFMRSHPMP